MSVRRGSNVPGAVEAVVVRPGRTPDSDLLSGTVRQIDQSSTACSVTKFLQRRRHSDQCQRFSDLHTSLRRAIEGSDTRSRWCWRRKFLRCRNAHQGKDRPLKDFEVQLFLSYAGAGTQNCHFFAALEEENEREALHRRSWSRFCPWDTDTCRTGPRRRTSRRPSTDPTNSRRHQQLKSEPRQSDGNLSREIHIFPSHAHARVHTGRNTHVDNFPQRSLADRDTCTETDHQSRSLRFCRESTRRSYHLSLCRQRAE